MAKYITSAFKEKIDKPSSSSQKPTVNIKLLPYKCFYFLFYSSAGSLFPYLAIFYKQLFLSAQQTGILLGIGPLVQLIGSSIWGIIADNCNKSKQIFLLSLVAGLISNFSLSLVRRPVNTSPCDDNGTLSMFDNVLHVTARNSKSNMTGLINDDWKIGVSRRTLTNDSTRNIISPYLVIGSETVLEQNSSARNSVIEKTTSELREKNERKLDELSALGHPPWSLLIFKAGTETCQHHIADDGVFYILLMITIVGNFIAAPTIPFADTATLQCLGDAKDYYGGQRQWGTLGYGVSSFVVSAAVTTMQEKTNCNVPIHIDYTPCFYAFAILMITAFIPASFFYFEDRRISNISVAGAVRSLLNSECCTYLGTILFSGCSWGLIEVFLFWHLHNLGGTQFLFSLIAAIHCFSECATFSLAGHLIKVLGHYRLLYLSLVFSSFRFTFYGVLSNPWLVLPIEMFHGLSTSLVWSLAVSFTSTKAGVVTTVQVLLYGLTVCLGFGGGTILCGFLVNRIGSPYTFFVFGTTSILNLLVLFTMRNMTCLYNQAPSVKDKSHFPEPETISDGD